MAGHLNPTEEAALIQFAFVVVSILTAWTILRVLKGSAEIKHKGIQFGGSAAMFVAVFFLLNKVHRRDTGGRSWSRKRRTRR